MDGWNKDKLYEIINIFDEVYDINYEIKNCVRGSFTYVDTYKDLQAKLLNLAERLTDEVEQLDTTEDDDTD